MALHLNLYHEIHKQAERERRDPFKIAGLAGVVVLLCLVIWYSYRVSAVRKVEFNRNLLQADWSKLEPQMKAAIENEGRSLTRQKTNQALLERIQERFYWAPLLDKLAAITPEYIQITTITGELGANKENKKTVMLLVRGVAAGGQPRTVAEEYRRTLEERFTEKYGEASAVFDANSLEDGVETVNLDGETLPTAMFRIRVQFNPKSAK